MFLEVKNKVRERFNSLSGLPLFYKAVDRDKIWELYLNGFADPIERQGHNCNCCKSFLRQYAGIVAIDNDFNVHSIWDIKDVPELFKQSITNIKNYIDSLPVTEVFYNFSKNAGTDKNTTADNVTWNHFHIEIPLKYVKREKDIPSAKADVFSRVDVLHRSFSLISDDSCQTVIELINQGSLYRGNEYLKNVHEFQKLLKQYNSLSPEKAKVFAWVISPAISSAVSMIKNTVIGTLLVDLTEGKDLDHAVSAYERMVAPTNYKRPKALVTPRMVEEAKKAINELGYTDSLERRLAIVDDLNINNVIFRQTSSGLKDVFDEITTNVVVNPKTLSKTEEISIDDFIKNVLPSTKKVELLLENRHLPNMVGLITAVHPESKGLFTWNNNFSWSYTGGITDAIKERVKAAGGSVEGDLRISLSWNNYDDLDLHLLNDRGMHCYFRNTKTGGAHLDVDENAGYGKTRTPVENIIVKDFNSFSEGNYIILVHPYSIREKKDEGFTLQIEVAGETYDVTVGDNTKEFKIEFTYTKKEGVKFLTKIQSSVASKQKWGLNTNQFVNVNNILLSPNYWGQNHGNKHFILSLDGCEPDEELRPFFNEFLTPEIITNKRMFEVLGSKIKVENTAGKKVAGLGFSETIKNSFIVRVEGKFKRNLKINI